MNLTTVRSWFICDCRVLPLTIPCIFLSLPATPRPDLHSRYSPVLQKVIVKHFDISSKSFVTKWVI